MTFSILFSQSCGKLKTFSEIHCQFPDSFWPSVLQCRCSYCQEAQYSKAMFHCQTWFQLTDILRFFVTHCEWAKENRLDINDLVTAHHSSEARSAGSWLQKQHAWRTMTSSRHFESMRSIVRLHRPSKQERDACRGEFSGWLDEPVSLM